MIVKDIMSTPVITADEDVHVTEVAELMSQNRIHGIPVVKDGIPIGIITESDFFTKGAVNIYLPGYIELIKDGLMSKTASGAQKANVDKLLEARAKDVMSYPCITVQQDADIDDFMEIIRQQELSSVPVIDQIGKLVGIITVADIINLVRINNK